jgi:DNA-binding PadR family transcriptional regulator
MIDIRTLFEIAEMFRFRWDPAILACLEEQPLRYRALARQLGSRIDDRVEDNALSRSLGRLRRNGLVAAHRTMVGRRTVPTYHITDEGHGRLDRYRSLAQAFQRSGDGGSGAG